MDNVSYALQKQRRHHIKVVQRSDIYSVAISNEQKQQLNEARFQKQREYFIKVVQHSNIHPVTISNEQKRQISKATNKTIQKGRWRLVLKTNSYRTAPLESALLVAEPQPTQQTNILARHQLHYFVSDLHQTLM